MFNTLNDDIRFSDVNDIYVLAPLVLIMAIFSYTIRTRVFDKIHGIDLSELNNVNWKGELSDNHLDIESNKASTSSDAEPIDDDNDPVYMAQ
ncbi:MAG: hypothetical protein ACI86L_002086 [Dokdonia sp.]